MPRPPRLARLLVVALGLALPAVEAEGCGGRTACFTSSAGQACPSPESIDMSIASSNANIMCEGAISSVDGPGTLDGDLCCYPVSYVSGGLAVPCDLGGVGFGGGITTVGMGGGFSSSSSSSGFAGGPTTTVSNCVSCDEALNGSPFNQVCNPTPLANLRVCGCASECTTACDPTLCLSTGNPPDNGCLSCLQENCATELQTCQSQ